MSVDSNLREQLKQQMSRESETIQTVTREQLDAMRSELKGIYSGALSTIESDTQQETKRLAKRFKRLMLLPSLLLVMISIAISAGALAFTQYQYEQIEEHRQTLSNLETFGVEPVRANGKDYLLLPKGATLSKVDQDTNSGRPFVELKR